MGAIDRFNRLFIASATLTALVQAAAAEQPATNGVNLQCDAYWNSLISGNGPDYAAI